MPIKYRKLVPGDSGSYRKIRLVSLQTHPESFGASYDEQKLQPKLMFEKAIEQPVDDHPSRQIEIRVMKDG